MSPVGIHIARTGRRRTMSACSRGLLGLVVALIVTVGVAHSPAFAAAVLEIKPITWDIIGLDSNDPSTGPDRFPVGARVCNTGNAAANNVAATLVFDSPLNSFVHLEGNAALGLASLPSGVGFYDIGPDRPAPIPAHCADFY